MIRKKTRRIGPAPSFICGLISAAGLIAHFILKACGPSYGEAQLGWLYMSVLICLPVILFFWILSLIIGFRVKTESRFKWWLLPGGAALALAIGYFMLVMLWVDVSGWLEGP